MIDLTSTVEADNEHRLPAAYSQGFAHVRVLTVIDPDDPGPLGSSLKLGIPLTVDMPLESAPRFPLEDLLRAD